jgi:methylmalonyl-CoA/ethylmalonyl-CoA epimerase
VLKKIHHVAVVVKSADESLKFYRDALGLPVTKDEVIEDQGVRGVLLQAGAGEIELIEPVREGTGVARFLETKGEGLHHICFESDDVAAELTASAAKGLALIDQSPRKGLAGMIGFLHPKATRGVLIEYATPIPGEEAHATHGTGHVTELDHIVVAVSDFEAGVVAWQSNFGLSLDQQADLPELGVKAAVLPIGNATVEVCAPLGDGGPLATFLNERGEGLYVVSLRVDRIEAAVASLRAKGVRVTDPAPVGGIEGTRLVFISPRSAHGAMVQLIERGGA